MTLTSLSLSELRQKLSRREISAEEITRAYLQKIEEKDQKISAFITILKDEALTRAREIDRKPDKGRLAGIPVAIKDNILTKGVRTTCASRILENYVPPYSATVVERLEAEDAVIIGKTNLDEFAMGSSTENSAFFTTRNPWNLERVPGGSSGGSAAAVAAGEVPAALGSDTGGSIRQPAAFCGIVGLKPTYGRVSRYGLVAFASSLDQIGPLAGTVEDCVLITQVIAGHDPRDSTSSRCAVPQYREEMKEGFTPLRVGYLGEEVLKDIDPQVKEAYDHAVKMLEKEGVECEEMKFSLWEYALPCYYIIAPSEASSNLARYDGVRYGFRHQDYQNLKEMYWKTRTIGFGTEVKRRILLGTFALSSGYYDAFYGKAAKTRRLICREFEKAFSRVHLILTPTTPEPAFTIGAKSDPIAMYLSDIFTVTANLSGLPAISLPVGLSRERLPLALQIIGNYFQESLLFQLAFFLEKKVKFKNNRSTLSWKEER